MHVLAAPPQVILVQTEVKLPTICGISVSVDARISFQHCEENLEKQFVEFVANLAGVSAPHGLLEVVVEFVKECVSCEECSVGFSEE